MSMNRETKRMLQRQGQLGADGTPVREQRRAPATTTRAPHEERKALPARVIEFLREVRGELRKVAWPTKSEVINYSIIVLIAVVLVTALVAGLDFGFGSLVLTLFNK